MGHSLGAFAPQDCDPDSHRVQRADSLDGPQACGTDSTVAASPGTGMAGEPASSQATTFADQCLLIRPRPAPSRVTSRAPAKGNVHPNLRNRPGVRQRGPAPACCSRLPSLGSPNADTSHDVTDILYTT